MNPPAPPDPNQPRVVPTTEEKALRINLDAQVYGTFAEIGAGQEVARWFFRVGAASGTIAKSMSAYDMAFSDAIYGAAERYVSRQRLEAMLNLEYSLLIERLHARRGDRTRFFVFADTVAAQGFKRRDDCHGWMGIRFQTEPAGEPSQILIHVRMWDRENVQQQEALGIMGVNLLHQAVYLREHKHDFVPALIDNLSTERVEVDMIELSGPAFRLVDNRLVMLELVSNGLTDAAMFDATGVAIQPADTLYKKAILVERGSFRPITKVTLDMLRCAEARFLNESPVQGQPVVEVMEMTLHNLLSGGRIDPADFLDRVDLLGTLGKSVLISNFAQHFRLAAYLHRYTKQMVGMVMGVPTLRELFEEKYYDDLGGGILESFGRLFKNDLKLYVYPMLDPDNKELVTADNLKVAPNLKHLYQYLLQNNFIESLPDYDPACLPILSPTVLSLIKQRDPSWETMVPPQVAEMIKQRRLFARGDA
jgi:hypothetical protein